jgi:hypothetical protein
MKKSRAACLRWQFVLGSGFSSRLIAWYGEGYGGFSHVDAILPNGDCLGARSDVIRGVPAGFQCRPAAYETWKRRTVLQLSCTAKEAVAWEASLFKKIGAGYDQADILGFILGRPLMQPGHWICSAAQLDTLEEIGRIPKLPLTPQQCPPNMLFAMLCALGAVCVTEPA